MAKMKNRYLIVGVFLLAAALIAVKNSHENFEVKHEAEVGDSGRHYTTTEIYNRADCTEKSKRQLLLGSKDLNAGNLATAVDVYKNIIDEDPNCNAAYNNLGTAYFYMDDYSRSEEMYLEASKRDPENPLPLVSLGLIYSITKGSRSAIPFYQNALDLNPNEPRANWGIGLEYLSIGDKANAEKYLRNFIRLSPNSVDAETAKKYLRNI